MNQTTENILKYLNTKSIQANLEKLIEADPTYSEMETTIIDALKIYQKSRSLIIEVIDNKYFDEEVSYLQRKSILETLRSLTGALNPKQAPQSVQPYRNSTSNYTKKEPIKHILKLSDAVKDAKIPECVIGYIDFKEEVVKISQSKQRINSINKKLESISEHENQIRFIQKSIKENDTALVKMLEDFNKAKQIIEDASSLISKRTTESKDELQKIHDIQLNVQAFNNNVEEYKERLKKLTEEAEAVIKQDEKIKTLIHDAESALQLNSTVGISAAFSAHYLKISESGILKCWMAGVIAFTIIGIVLSIWFSHIEVSSSNVFPIIGRSFSVLIALSIAAFCGKQYVRQKNLMEDYAYKSVLAKSIVAFSEEIKKHNDGSVSDYLLSVLAEIHQDPLRQRENLTLLKKLLSKKQSNPIKRGFLFPK